MIVDERAVYNKYTKRVKSKASMFTYYIPVNEAHANIGA
jgi:hypothetical protein